MRTIIDLPEHQIKALADFCAHEGISRAEIAEEAAILRRTHRLKFPDAIIWATARQQGALLVTRNAKDFPLDDPSIRVPYRLA